MDGTEILKLVVDLFKSLGAVIGFAVLLLAIAILLSWKGYRFKIDIGPSPGQRRT
jgi:hypothetical protein